MAGKELDRRSFVAGIFAALFAPPIPRLPGPRVVDTSRVLGTIKFTARLGRYRFRAYDVPVYDGDRVIVGEFTL